VVIFNNRQFIIDFKPVFILSGEVHYFRLRRDNWQHIIDEAKNMGLNCIASYVPWILHEEIEGDYDFEGNLDLGAFIDLCADNGLYFFVRPGPFIMAEMKNEGIPYWIYEKYPDAVPIGYESVKAKSRALDYLHSGFLNECKKWYEKVMGVIVPRLHCKGGNVIGIQLDNEIGMLNWITDFPLLNDNVLNKFSDYLRNKYSETKLRTRYPFEIKPALYHCFRAPSEDYAAAFHSDFNEFMRIYYAEYIRTLTQYASDYGVKNTPFFVNIHGTGGGRIFDFPLGISQLYRGYNLGNGCISGADMYLGEPTIGNYQDLYTCNAYTAASNKKGQPLTAIEFECGDGTYCSQNGYRYNSSSTSQNMVTSLAQDARMINLYVFSGGTNYYLKHPRPDGNMRMAFTGELHGFSAPVEPDGSHNFSFDKITDTAHSIKALNSLIGSAVQQTDDIALAFIPDYFLTETSYSKSKVVCKIHDNLKRFRCFKQIDSPLKAFLNANINMRAIDIQNEAIRGVNNLLVMTCLYTPESVQQALVDYLREGHNLILYGEIPMYDIEGNPCTVLKDALELGEPDYLADDQPGYYLTVHSENLDHFVADQRCDFAQCFSRDDNVLLSVIGSDLMCGFQKSIGGGVVTAITCNYPCIMDFYNQIIQMHGINPIVHTDYYKYGIFASLSSCGDGQQLLFLLNLDTVEKKANVYIKDKIMFENFVFFNKQFLILPINVKLPCATVIKSTAQINGYDDHSIKFRLSQPSDTIVLKTNGRVMPSDDYVLEEEGDDVMITSKKHAKLENKLVVKISDTRVI